MFRPRIIPVLLLKGNALVKSKGFKDFRYIGDPINAVKVFNDLKADELVFLDIEATKEKRTISTELVSQVGEEANMPFAVGGGIRNLDEIQNIIAKGAEKVIINTCAVENPKFIREASDNFGSSTIVVCIDVKKKFFSLIRESFSTIGQIYLLTGLHIINLIFSIPFQLRFYYLYLMALIAIFNMPRVCFKYYKLLKQIK